MHATPARLTESALQRLPHVDVRTLLAALVIFFVFVAAMETRLKARGIQPSAADNYPLWMHQRARASTLSERALILVGASRMQTDMDLEVLRVRTRLEPVQLAIDGSSFLPVLHGLAKDPAIRGTVIVSFMDGTLAAQKKENDAAEEYEGWFQRHQATDVRFDYSLVEDALAAVVRNHLRSYADGARPLSTMLTRVVPAVPKPQYVVILPDRSRLADFSKVDSQAVYFGRVVRELGTDSQFDNMSYDSIEQRVRTEIDALAPVDDTLYLQRAATVTADAAAIESRGGHVIFVVMPTSGLITRMEQKRFPRDRFWDRFATITKSRTLNFQDVPVLRTCPVPDGSHIDYRNRPQLTSALLIALGMDDSGGKPAIP